ncbi:hypothetical protein BXJ34_23740 [Salmonella enterica subsp. enterica serovar Enteritidis]|nr:hypothetical protein [Salmonella enterica subsp. enterica serovar Enteritidis]EID4746854.1 hypothetical protein [Salmonella enterica]HAW9157261.1 hypothetical protein [Salmonella enterica subsp. enterica serovar Infantis]ECJ7263881.1 hypothetical protein [Salmonella enterica subsp. enterica serovar Enteritidis]EIK8447751.1 hypothetical protein [Salmonella enterica]
MGRYNISTDNIKSPKLFSLMVLIPVIANLLVIIFSYINNSSSLFVNIGMLLNTVSYYFLVKGVDKHNINIKQMFYFYVSLLLSLAMSILSYHEKTLGFSSYIDIGMYKIICSVISIGLLIAVNVIMHKKRIKYKTA